MCLTLQVCGHFPVSAPWPKRFSITFHSALIGVNPSQYDVLPEAWFDDHDRDRNLNFASCICQIQNDSDCFGRKGNRSKDVTDACKKHGGWCPYSATLCHFFSESMASIQSLQPSKSTSGATRGFYLGSIGLRLSCHRLRSHQSDGIHSLPTIRWCGCYSECQQHQEGHVTQPAKCD